LSVIGFVEKFRRVDDLVEHFAGELKEAAASPQAIIYLKEPDGKTLAPRGGNAGDPVAVDEESLPGRAALYGETVAPPGGMGAAVPFFHFGSVAGVLHLSGRDGGYDLPFLQGIQHSLQELPAALSMVAGRESLDNLALRHMELAALATDQVTPEGPGHVMRVVSISSVLAARLDLSPQVRSRLWTGAVFHDLGKLILQGREPWEIERLHTIKGAEHLEQTMLLRDASALVQASHERFDGTGFPLGLSGDAVPIEGWVLAMAEDLEEFYSASRGSLWDTVMERFIQGRAFSHHPLVTEALAGAAGDGQIKGILEG
jgi:hypothetical protein